MKTNITPQPTLLTFLLDFLFHDALAPLQPAEKGRLQVYELSVLSALSKQSKEEPGPRSSARVGPTSPPPPPPLCFSTQKRRGGSSSCRNLSAEQTWYVSVSTYHDLFTPYINSLLLIEIITFMVLSCTISWWGISTHRNDKSELCKLTAVRQCFM